MTHTTEENKFRKPTIKFGDIFISSKNPENKFKIIEKFKNGEFLAIDNSFTSGAASVNAIKVKEVGFYYNNNRPIAVVVDAEDNFYKC